MLQGPRRQPKGFTKNQVLAAAVDPRTKNLNGVRQEEHQEVWDLVTVELVERMVEEDAASETAAAAAAAAAAAFAAAAAAAATTEAAAADAAAGSAVTESSAVAGGGGAARKRRRISGFLDQSVGEPMLVPEQHQEMPARSRFTAVALQEIGSFRKLPTLPPKDANKKHTNPLLWWKTHATEFPQLAKLARRVLCIPATSAPSERIFSVAGQVATQKRNRLAPDTVALLVYLRNAWPPAEAWRKKHPAEPKKR